MSTLLGFVGVVLVIGGICPERHWQYGCRAIGGVGVSGPVPEKRAVEGS
jgi:hypothetical protein